MMLNKNEAERFSALCLEDVEASLEEVKSGINTYNEKRLHRILKRTLCSDEGCFEVKLGRYIADILENGRITEIQCGSFYPLGDKIRYYLENTDYTVTVVHPVIESKTLYRADKESGEILRSRRSSKKESQWSVLPDMIYLSDFVVSPRFCLRLVFVSADEYRFSDRVRFRKSGAYDSDLRPRELTGSISFASKEDYAIFLPDKECFDSAEYSSFSKLKGRRLYYALGFLCAIGLLEKQKQGNKNIYTRKDCQA